MPNTNHVFIVLINYMNKSGYRQKVIWDSLMPSFEYDDVENTSTSSSPRGQKVRCYLSDILQNRLGQAQVRVRLGKPLL